VKYMVICSGCGKGIDPEKANGIYGRYGMKYFCHKKMCQEIFLEHAGDIPDDYDDPRPAQGKEE
jgi:hypothetical protein